MITFPEGTFYELPRSVSLRLFSYRECPHRTIGLSAGIADRVGNRISAECKAAYRIDRPSRLAQSRKSQPADYRQAFRAHRCQPSIDVVLGLFARRQRELPTPGRTLGQQREKRGMIGHGAGGYGFL